MSEAAHWERTQRLEDIDAVKDRMARPEEFESPASAGCSAPRHPINQ